MPPEQDLGPLSPEITTLKERDIEIYNIDILSINYDENEIEFSVSCSKGTYIRTLCEDIAKSLGTIGYMSSLKRTKINDFKIEDSITLDELEKNKDDILYLKEKFISVEKIFEDKNKIELNDRKKELFLNGVKLTFKLENNLYRVYNNNKFLGMGVIENDLLKRDVIVID